jgi:hypothetical protein
MSLTAARGAMRLLAALMLAAVVAASLAGTALAGTGTITQQDCKQGTIKDTAGNSISKARCEKLVGKSVHLAGTGLDLWPFAIAGVLCIAGAGVLTVRAHRPVRLFD